MSTAITQEEPKVPWGNLKSFCIYPLFLAWWYIYTFHANLSPPTVIRPLALEGQIRSQLQICKKSHRYHVETCRASGSTVVVPESFCDTRKWSSSWNQILTTQPVTSRMHAIESLTYGSLAECCSGDRNWKDIECLRSDDDTEALFHPCHRIGSRIK